MNHKRAFEAVNRLMQDIIESKHQMWKIDDKKLTDKSGIWNTDDEWEFIEDDSLFYVKNVTRNKVLTVVSDGKVSLQAFSGQLKTRQL